VDAPAQPVDHRERQDAGLGEQMSRNGFNECEREYNRREEAVEMAKDQRELEKEQLWGKSQSVRAEKAEARAAAANDLLREARLSLDPFEFPELCQRIDAAIAGEKK
jgi:hypothetical protein